MNGFTVKSFLRRLSLIAVAVAVLLSLSACGGAGSDSRFGGPPPETLIRPDVGIGGHIKRVPPPIMR